MDADAILQRARAGEAPTEWMVWRLRRDVVMRSAVGWTAAGVFGVFLFIVTATQTIPENFTHGGGGIVLTSLLLAAFAALGIGAASIAVYDFWRLTHADEYLLVITPDDYLKAEPRKITHVPMEHVTFVTLQGVNASRPQNDLSAIQAESKILTDVGRGRLGSGLNFLGARRQPKQAPSLAFLDSRTDEKVIVGTDNSFDELPVLEQMLGHYAGRISRSRTG